MRADDERDELELVTALQDAVQPAGVPVLPMLDVEGRCIVSSHASEPGGSWFDAFVMPDGRLAMAVGEAPGIGLTPSVTAARMSAVIRAGLRRDADVVAALQLADAHAGDLADSRGTAATIVLVDPGHATATYATAGHPPPLLLPASGRAVIFGDTGGGPLGAGVDTRFAEATESLAAGDGLLLASPAAHRLAFEGQSAQGGGDWPAIVFTDLHNVADQLARRIAVDDTLCLVAARLRLSPHPTLALQMNDETDSIQRAREELRTWLAQLRASSMDQMALTHAALELMANAVAYGGQGVDRQANVEARLDADGYVQIEVTNSGAWHARASDAEYGRGLAMAAGLVDHLAVAEQASGVRVRLRHRLVRPVAIEVSDQASGQPIDAVQLTREAPQSLSLRGSVSHDEVERLAAEILLATRGGTVPVSLDLTAVTRLSSTAVRLLDDLTTGQRRVGMNTAEIEILATPDSVTQRALALARVPYRAG